MCKLLESIHTDKLTDNQWKELLTVTHSSFKEHHLKGLHMLPCTVTLERYKQFLRNCQVFIVKKADKIVAYNAGRLIQEQNITYVSVQISCVLPSHKRQGLGKLIHQALEDWATNQGCRYLLIDTSCKAKSSLAYHHSCGFENWLFTHWTNTNYYSIILRKELPVGKKMSRKLRYKALIKSYIATHFRYTENGKERFIYRWLKRIFSTSK